jgi:uncharacterized iron-regulated protein
MRALFVLLLALLPACSSMTDAEGHSEGATTSGAMNLSDLQKELKGADVVFFGELHDNTLAHQQRFMLFQKLAAERGDVIVSMEMFERDVQTVLTQYLAGEITEKEFLAASRPWGGYSQHYRPFVEFAKQHGFHVIAANAPRPLVRKLRTEGWEAIAGSPHIARKTTAPKDAYWERFKATMQGHMGTDEERIYSFYKSQCLWDDTMAESIADALEAAHAEGRRPLVVHLVGQFHVQSGGGTKIKLLERMPELDVKVLSMTTAPNVRLLENGDYQLTLPPQPKRSMGRSHGLRPRMPVPQKPPQRSRS